MWKLRDWLRYPSSKYYEIDENVQFGIWQSAVATSKTAIWVHNYSPSRAEKPQRYFGKFTSCMTFGAPQSCSFRAIFLTIYTATVTAELRRCRPRVM